MDVISVMSVVHKCFAMDLVWEGRFKSKICILH